MECFKTIEAALGVCLEKRIDLGNAVLAALAVVGLFSLLLAYRQLRIAKEAELLQARATRARFVLDLNQEFLNNDAERDFFYKLDYQDFQFDSSTFAQSNDERQLDRLLYKLSYVGKLLRDGLVTLEDISNIRHIASRTLRNTEVIKYLRYLKEEQIPDHSSFSDSIYLFERLFGRSDAAYSSIVNYLTPGRPAPATSSIVQPATQAVIVPAPSS